MVVMSSDSDYNRRQTAGEAAENESSLLAHRSRLERLGSDRLRSDLKWEDITIHEPIGYGGFSQVFKVEMDGRPGEEFALKCLNPQTKLRTKSFKTGAVDLAIEGEILSRLEHENVIKLHGICDGGPLNAYMDTDRGYFLVLDLLEDTLSDKLDKYRSAHKASRRGSGFNDLGSSRRLGSGSSNKHMSQSAVLERVSCVAMGVAKGMEYLHSQGVALRDLKPDNVGFDVDGTPKIFDLGFAREEHTIRSREVAGSLRYMAPEVALAQGSQLSSDVYSFGVLLWELCTLEKPYKHINSRDDFMSTVIAGEWRHSTSKIPSNSLRKLIKECWQTDASKRPTFTQIVKKLRVELSLTKITPSKNKGFGSSVNLKRTATWTAKKLSSGISSNSFGMLRIGFKSNSSLGKKSDSEQSPVSSKGGANATFPSKASSSNLTATAISEMSDTFGSPMAPRAKLPKAASMLKL